jgi:hypothetical protein
MDPNILVAENAFIIAARQNYLDGEILNQMPNAFVGMGRD